MRHLFVITCVIVCQHAYSQAAINKIDSLIKYSIDNKLFRGSVLVVSNDSIIYQKTNGVADVKAARDN